MTLLMYGNYPEMRETEGKLCGKNLSMEMSLFLYGNSAEMMETEGKFCGKNLAILCFRQQRSRVVSAIIFEGFKLHSSNLTHALFI